MGFFRQDGGTDVRIVTIEVKKWADYRTWLVEELTMKSTKRIHLSYVAVILAILSVGATFSVRTLLVEIGPTATVTGVSPEIEFHDDTVGDQDWEIEVNQGGLGFFEIAGLGSTTGSGPFKIHRDAVTDQLTLGSDGNVAINGETASVASNNLEVFNAFGAAIAVTPDPNDASARFYCIDSLGREAGIAIDPDDSGYHSVLNFELEAPDSAISVAADGDIGLGVFHQSIAAGIDLQITGGQVLLDPTGTDGDWTLSPSATTGLSLNNGGNTTVRLANGAPSDSFVVGDTGGIGLGTAMPDSPLHVFRNDGTAQLKVEETSGTTAIRQLMNLQNNGGVRFSLENTSNARQWEFTNDSAGNFNISLVGTGGRELGITPAGQMIVGPGGNPSHIMSPNGNLIIQGSLTEGSSRTIKENFQAVDCDEVLAKVVDMEITTWNYKHDEDNIRHMGPVAEDFRDAFSLGENDTSIAAMDKDGVALASIQALNKRLEAREARIRQLEAELERQATESNRRLEALEAAIARMAKE